LSIQNNGEKSAPVLHKQPVAISQAIKDAANVINQTQSGSTSTGGAPSRVFAAPGTQFTVVQSGQIKLASGNIFTRVDEDTHIQTPMGLVHAAKGAMVSVTASNGLIRVASCNGPNKVWVKAGCKEIALSAGSELVLGKNEIAPGDAMPTDGVARRETKMLSFDGGMQGCINEFSLV